MFSNRDLQFLDSENIVNFPQSEEELFYMFPKASYPLKPEVFVKESESRFYPTVAILNQTLAGYANFINLKKGVFCSIGNVIINPILRKRGVASYLVKTLETIAFKEINAKYVKISCFNDNTAGLLLYHKLGYVPFEAEVRQAYNGQQTVLIHMKKQVMRKF